MEPSFLNILSPDEVLKATIGAKPKGALAAQLAEAKSWEAPRSKKEQCRKLGSRSSSRGPDVGSAAVAPVGQPGLGVPNGSSVEEDSSSAAAGRELPDQLELEGHGKESSSSLTNVDSTDLAAVKPVDFKPGMGGEDGFGKGKLEGPALEDSPSTKTFASKKLAPFSQETTPSLGKQGTLKQNKSLSNFFQ